ncbi:plasmolipin [Thalassophryne amazonica]|uniref:plasmolipin n=1 Tax=Thalassophryne amazonica TaxID=390379 RepID=UPI001470B41A|nr:plasmolipin [Thalassophryne amazonica]
MADFPSKVTTETSSPQSSQEEDKSLRRLFFNITNKVDVSFLRSIPAILMVAEIVFGLVHWTLIASTNYRAFPVYGWVMFVAITLWILTTILFFMNLFVVQVKLTFIPWTLMVMVYHGAAVLLYVTAFVANAASVHKNHYMAAAAFFGAVVTIAYGASAYFSYMYWRRDGGNAATSTLPT